MLSFKKKKAPFYLLRTNIVCFETKIFGNWIYWETEEISLNKPVSFPNETK